MFGFFKKSSPAPAASAQTQALAPGTDAFDLTVLDDTVQRWRTFAAKIRARADELHDQGFTEALRLSQNTQNMADESEAYLFWSGITGQIGTLRAKAEATFEKNVQAEFEAKAGTWVESWGRSDIRAEAEDLWHQLQDERNALDAHLLHKSCPNHDALNNAKDPEQSLQRILDEFATLQTRFACSNCGAQVPIQEVFFLATYVDCAYCRTKNTFYPSDIAYTLPAVAEKVAQRRVQGAHDAWQQAEQAVPSWSASADNPAAFHEKRGRAVALHAEYINAKHDEIDRIVPALKAHNDLIRRARIEAMNKTTLRH